jgi:hypothetical protein
MLTAVKRGLKIHSFLKEVICYIELNNKLALMNVWCRFEVILIFIKKLADEDYVHNHITEKRVI